MYPACADKPLDGSAFAQDSSLPSPVVVVDEITLLTQVGELCFGCKMALRNQEESSKVSQLGSMMASLMESLNEFKEAQDQMAESLHGINKTVEV
jgi:hypothetical protein